MYSHGMMSEDVVVGSIDDIFPKGKVAVNYSVGCSNVFFRRCGNSSLLVGLKHPCALYFQGILDIHVLMGEVVLDGYVLSSSKDPPPLRVFSLNVGSAHFLSPTNNSQLSTEDVVGFDHCPEFKAQYQDLVGIVEPVGCVLCVASRASDYQRWVVAFDRHKFDVLPKPQRVTGFSLFAEFEDILETVLDVEDGSRIVKKMKFSSHLQNLADRLAISLSKSVNTITIVCGGKGVGKSSSMRYLVNRFLGTSPNVLCIDLDIGQPEFTMCGCISATVVSSPLIGPNYTHLKTPLKSYFIGDINPLQCLNAYTAALQSLIAFCHESEECKSMPWVVNTMGYTKGLGLDIIASIISYVKPHHVIQISSPNRQDNFVIQIDSSRLSRLRLKMTHAPLDQLLYTHHRIDSSRKAQTLSRSSLSSARLREVMAVAYFADILGYSGEGFPDEWQHFQTTSPDGHNPVIGDIVALTAKEGKINKIFYGYGMVSDISEERLTILSPISADLFSQASDILTAPIQFKASIILSHFREKLNSYPFFCTFNPTDLRPEQQVLMASLFGLE